MGRNASFGADDETHQVLSKLGYSHGEIHAATSNLPDDMGSEDRIRHSLRALSANHSEGVQAEAQAKVRDFAPANPTKAQAPNESSDYWQGRKDQQEMNKQNKPPKTATPSRKRAPAPGAKEYKTAKSLAKMARMLGGAKR